MFKGFVSCSHGQIVILNGQTLSGLIDEMSKVPEALDGIIIGQDERIAVLIDLVSLKITWECEDIKAMGETAYQSIERCQHCHLTREECFCRHFREAVLEEE